MPVSNRYQNPGPPFHTHPEDNLRHFEREAAPWLQLANAIEAAREKNGEEWEMVLGDVVYGDPVDLLLQIVQSMNDLALQKLTECVWYHEAMKERRAKEVAHA